MSPGYLTTLDWGLPMTSTGVNFVSGNTTGAGYTYAPSAVAMSLACQPSSSNCAQLTTLNMRSSNDPYIMAYSLTGGSMDFGLTASQIRAKGVDFLVAGLVLGFVYGFCFVCCFFNIFRYNWADCTDCCPCWWLSSRSSSGEILVEVQVDPSLHVPQLPAYQLDRAPYPLPEAPLPPEWAVAYDKQGARYYYNARTEESSWDFPMATTKVSE